MPRVKAKKKQVKKKVIRKENKNFLRSIKVSESYVSLALGALVVLIVFVLGILFLNASRSGKNSSLTKETSSARTQLSVPEVLVTQTPEEKEKMVSDENKKIVESKKLPAKYTVQRGEGLWDIAEKVYGSGYSWVDIARANKISDPGLIFTGDVLILPDTKPVYVAGQEKPKTIEQIGMSQASGAILGNTYTIVKGDDLWNIAVRAYGDGYKYVDIIKANNLENPSLIFSGNVLKIPRG